MPNRTSPLIGERWSRAGEGRAWPPERRPFGGVGTLPDPSGDRWPASRIEPSMHVSDAYVP